MSEKKANHQANVVRIEEVLPHPNADKLDLINVGAYQVVVAKDQFKVGDLGVYIQPDSVVPQTEPFKFIWWPYVGLDGTVPERRRRITVRKFRKEYSEGLLLPITDFAVDVVSQSGRPVGFSLNDGFVISEGDDISDLIGVTHYAPPEPTIGPLERRQQYKGRFKSLVGFFYYAMNLLGIDLNKGTGGLTVKGPKNPPPVYDVESLKNFANAFEPNEPVIITEKIHGSNARYTFSGDTMYVGSRTQWKSPKSDTVWHKALRQHPEIEKFCRAFPGYTLYGEVTPTQGGYNYGCAEGEVKFFGFDVYDNGSGYYLNKMTAFLLMQAYDIKQVPMLFLGPFDLAFIKSNLVDGRSAETQNHIREGVVISPETDRDVRGIGRLQLKLVSNKFLEKEVS